MTAPKTIDGAMMTDDTIDTVSKALRRAWQLGQTYWQQADSDSYKQQDKSDETQKKFEALVDETRAMLASSPAAPAQSREPVTWRDAIKSYPSPDMTLAPQPSQPVEAGDEVPVEVWHGDRKVTIYTDCVLRVWGANIESEMSDAPRTLQSVQDSMDWLYAPSAVVLDGERAFRTAVQEMVRMLEEGEWAEHVSTFNAPGDDLAMRLEVAITDLHNHYASQIAMASERAASPQPAINDGQRSNDALFARVTHWVNAHGIPFEAQNELFRLLAASTTWEALFDRVALELNCLPSASVDGNDHVFHAIEKLRAASPQATDQRCYAPGCHQWDGTDSCTCQKATATQPAQTERALTLAEAAAACDARALDTNKAHYLRKEARRCADAIRALLTAAQPASGGDRE